MLISLSIVRKLANLNFPTIWWIIAFVIDATALIKVVG